MSKPDGGPAFPVPNDANVNQQPGMTLRDYFAAKALPTIISVCGGDYKEPGESLSQYFARKAYECADAMLAERAK